MYLLNSSQIISRIVNKRERTYFITIVTIQMSLTEIETLFEILSLIKLKKIFFIPYGESIIPSGPLFFTNSVYWFFSIFTSDNINLQTHWKLRNHVSLEKYERTEDCFQRTNYRL